MSVISPYLKIDFGVFKNVKLVLGNGFDLACGLNSSYGAFFESQSSLYHAMEEWCDNKGEFPVSATAWDLLFLILSKENKDFMNYHNLNWKDVETMIKISLVDSKTKIPYTFLNIHEGKHMDCKENKILKAYLDTKCDVGDKEAFYKFLYQELVRFEKRFSDFLEPQQKDPIYNENARRMFRESGLLKMDEEGARSALVSIDTFNYTTPEVFKELPKKVAIRHINGKLGSAIFGIDSAGIKVEDPAYRFTKAYRKMIDLVHGRREEFSRDFKNILIFGHSLAEADYSYFYSILDVINLDLYGKYQSRLIIGINDFCDNDADNEANRVILAESVMRMLSGYDHWKNPGSERHGIIEMLETADRVGFYKIDNTKLIKR